MDPLAFALTVGVCLCLGGLLGFKAGKRAGLDQAMDEHWKLNDARRFDDWQVFEDDR